MHRRVFQVLRCQHRGDSPLWSRMLRCSGLIVLLGLMGVPILPRNAVGQTILNTERFQLAEVDGFHLSADLSVSLQRGNTRLLDASTSGMVGTLIDRHWPRLIFGGTYLSGEDESILDQQFLQLRYSYILSPGTQTFHFVQAQKNETLLLRSRWLVGTGIRTNLIRTDATNFAVGTGLMREWERYSAEDLAPQDPTARSTLRVANLAVASHDFDGGARLLNIVYVQPDVRQFSDLRILNDLGLLVPITERVRSTVSLEWRRDARPPSTLGRNDVTLKAGFSIETH